MAPYLMWMMSFSAVAAIWICSKVTRFIWKDKAFLPRQNEQCEKLYEIIPRLEESLNDIQSSSKMVVLNKNQCVHLFGKLIQVMKEVQRMLSIATKNAELKYIFEELCCLQTKVEMMGRNCLEQDRWSHVVVFQLQNKEAFRELLYDMKCYYDAARHNFVRCHPNESHGVMNIHFDGVLFEGVQEDYGVLKMRLLHHKGGGEECKIVKHMLLRLRNLERVDGGDLDALEIPDDFVKPIVIREIGCGSYGKVFETSWLGISSATKVVEEVVEEVVEDALKPLMSARKEVGILASLSHPNLVQFLGCGIGKREIAQEDEGEKVCMYMVMEQMATSLSAILKKNEGSLPYGVAIDVMHQVAKGMYYLHDMQVAHLDLKPDNILSSSMMAKDSYPCCVFKLTDYGTSQLEVCSKPERLELSKYIVGTPKYMAPEMNKKSGVCLYPFQADVWSFAMTCSEILSGNAPFCGLKPKDIFNEITCTNGVDGKGKRPDLPNNCEELTNLIEECWSQDPLQRPTFANICERLANLKINFLTGRYSHKMIPQFGCHGIKRAPKFMHDHATKVNESNALQDEVVVDLKCQLSKAKDLLNMGYVGIVGMGGIGKTTLAKAIYDDVSMNSIYNACCFIAQCKDYQDSYQLLCKILQELGCDKKSKDLEHAQELMKELLASKKVLVVLDDIKDEAQVQDVVSFDSVHASKGTTIVLTTRDWRAIEALVGEKGKFKVEKLNEEEATKLFTTHLLQDVGSLAPDLLNLLDHVVKACNGLPLSLKVMGGFLCGKKRLRSWERALQRMKRGKNLDDDGRVWKTLQISFDGLNSNVEKRIFLDIACFFSEDVYPQGISKERALHMWSQNNILPLQELERLIDASLLKVNKNGNLDLHDQLRDMGRMIVKEEYGGTRIWKTSMIPEGGLASKDAKKLEGIYWQGFQGHPLCLIQDHEYQLEALRILIFQFSAKEALCNLKLLYRFIVRSCQLKMLSIKMPNEEFKLFYTPMDCGEKVLEISKETMQEKSTNHLTKKEESQIGGCFNFTALLEQVGNLTSLTTLELLGCSNLVALPEGVGNLTSLTSLRLSRCSKLVALPEGVGNLTSLTSLELLGCSSLVALPKGVGNLTSLTSLDLSDCTSLVALPEGVGNLTSLTSLDLLDCSSLVALPEGVGNLTSLTSLRLSRCSKLVALPEGVGNLTSLTSLDLSWCSKLVALPEGVGNLTSVTSLDLSTCSSLVALPEGVGNLTSLTSLRLAWCSSLVALPEGVGNLTSLTSLRLSGCSSLVALPEGVGNLTSLTSLRLAWCSSLVALPEGVGNLTSVTSLDLSDCSSLVALPEGVGNLTSLTSLDLSDCTSLVALPEGVGNLTSLTSLDLLDCYSLVALPEGVGNLTSLTSLRLSRCSKLVALPEGVGNLTSLTSLDLSWCSKLVALPEGVGNLTSVTSLDLSGCSSLVALPKGVGNLTSLTSLELFRCSSLVALPEGVGNLTSLTSLRLPGCSSLVALPEGVGNLTSLTSLDLAWCSSLVALPEGMGDLTSLTSLDLLWCSSLVALPEGVGNLTSLTSLRLAWCSSLVALPEGVGNLTSLTSLDLSDCSSLVALPMGVGNLTSLTSLRLSRCSNLVALPEGVGNLTSLTSLDLSSCSSLVALPEGLGT